MLMICGTFIAITDALGLLEEVYWNAINTEFYDDTEKSLDFFSLLLVLRVLPRKVLNARALC
jgi:hypothetical protein